MISKASAKFVRITPRKVRYVIDRIRRKSVGEAQAILNGSPRRAGDIVRKILNQALDAAEKNSQVGAGSLMVSKVLADGGPTMKRFRAASMGRASKISKRTCHITLELDLARPGQIAAPKAPSQAKGTGALKAASASSPAKKKNQKSVHKKTVGAK